MTAPVRHQRTAVHPRACGEQSRCPVLHRTGIGSSPRMRGTARSAAALLLCSRFIPAHAGNRPISFPHLRIMTVHPRACGEQKECQLVFPYHPGSSPRMRGTGSTTILPGSRGRFIPAHAGNRNSKMITHKKIKVHPRACGEQSAGRIWRGYRGGSSPRMRGTGRVALGGCRVARFIPAHAGNRCGGCISLLRHSVHPRACGEQGLCCCCIGPWCGSSPRMRGTAAATVIVNGSVRFIPAHAGNSALPRPLVCQPAVHPRACGEQRSTRTVALRQNGSSPRMRGTAEFNNEGSSPSRFIPAHAGNRCPRQGI